MPLSAESVDSESAAAVQLAKMAEYPMFVIATPPITKLYLSDHPGQIARRNAATFEWRRKMVRAREAK